MKNVIGSLLVLGVVLLLIVVPNVSKRFVLPNSSAAKTDLIGIGSSIEEFVLAGDGRCPDSLKVLTEYDSQGQRFLDQDDIPVDPWGKAYRYEPAPDRQAFRLYTFGQDGRLGGEGEDADIYLSEIRRRHRAVPRAEDSPVGAALEPFDVPQWDHATPLRVDQPSPSEQPE